MAFLRQLLITSVAAVGMVGIGAGLGFASFLLPFLQIHGLGENKVNAALLPWIGKS